MVRDVRHFTITIPAGTTAANPQVSDLTMPPREVRLISVRIPPGPNGNVGFALGLAGTPILPSNAGAWYVGNDEKVEWPVDEQPNSGAWQLRAYNTGSLSHTLQVTFLADIPGQNDQGGILTPLEI